ncbi:alpha/beta fold hydrolase [Amycolatopsis sp. NPDC005232]|uniref:alpha/beta fold hydrolase n=1 Tax=Amycolatopsis sp. NPDC005232 TaxID=3157027 RepID=UPI0033AAFA35
MVAPTLPGLADGDDPRRFTLEDTVDFLVDLLDGHDLTDVTLVAHSWGGYPVFGAAHRVPHRVRRLVFHSAFVPENGVLLVEDVPPGHAALFRQLAQESGDHSALSTLGLPVSYLSGECDLAMPPGDYAWCPRFPALLGVEPITVPGDHEAFLTRPDAFVAALLHSHTVDG